MTLLIRCPHCDRTVELPNDYLGAGIRCPHCAVVFAVQQTGITTQEPAEPPSAPRNDLAEPFRLKDITLKQPRKYEPGRGRLLLALGLSSLALSVMGMIAGVLLCGAPVLFGLPAVGLGLPAWVMGQRDMEKIRRAVMDPYAEDTTRGGWVSGIIGTILGVLLTMGGMCGLYFMLLAATASKL